MVADTRKKFECPFFKEVATKYKNLPLPLIEERPMPMQIYNVPFIKRRPHVPKTAILLWPKKGDPFSIGFFSIE